MTEAFPLVESAIKELIEDEMSGATGNVGGDLAYDGTQDFYVWIGLIPGGVSDQIEGEWNVDIDVFGTNYAETVGRANQLEAILVGPRHVTSVMRIDNCYQNSGPAERPWDDDTVYRIGATYVFTARRSG